EVIDMPAGVVSENAPVVTTENGVVAANVSAEPVAPQVTLPKVQIRIKDTSWIQIKKSGSEKPVISQVYQAGEVIDVPRQNGLELVTSNAGGIEIVVGNDVVPSIGPSGAIRRGVSLDPAELKRRLP